MNCYSDLRKELIKFWNWSGIKKENYENHSHEGECEFYYPESDKLVEASCILIDHLQSSNLKESLELILEAIAIDNEGEDIANYCLDKMSEETYNQLVSLGLHFRYSNTRWQLAEMLGKRPSENSEKDIENLLLDENSYVRQRALISSFKINTKLAKNYAKEFIAKECDNLIRVAENLLKEYDSNKNRKNEL